MNAVYQCGEAFKPSTMPPWHAIPCWTSPVSFLILVSLLALVPFSSASACPEQCSCLTLPQGTRVHCRYQQLRYVPEDFPEDTFEIDFGHNVLEIISARTFPQLPNLRRLLLDFCQVREIEDFAFSHLTSLVYLRLSDNKITHIGEYAFDGLDSIQELHLDLNQLVEIPQGMFNGMTLKTLSLKGNNIASLESGVFQGAKITNLILDENRFHSVSKDSMQPLSESLKSLHLSRNKEPLTLQEEAFSDFELSELTVTFAGVKSSSFLCKVKAGSIDISGNPFQTLDFRDCGALSYTTEIYLRNLSIEMLDDTLMSALTQVTKLDLSQNKIFFINGDIFRHTHNLVSLDVSSNNLQILADDFGTHLGNLEVLNLSGNKLSELGYQPFVGMTNLQELALDRNMIQVLPGEFATLFNQLNVLKLGSNPIHCNCEMRWFRTWLGLTGKATGADFCTSPMMGIMEKYTPDQFICTSPRITSVTQHMNIQEGESILLKCNAEGDPAPEVEFNSPLGEMISVLPSFNRTTYKTLANWALNDIHAHQTGWYTCTASNIQGQAKEYIYINVVTNGSAPMDLATLSYPSPTVSPIVDMESSTSTTPKPSTTMTPLMPTTTSPIEPTTTIQVTTIPATPEREEMATTEVKLLVTTTETQTTEKDLKPPSTASEDLSSSASFTTNKPSSSLSSSSLPPSSLSSSPATKAPQSSFVHATTDNGGSSLAVNTGYSEPSNLSMPSTTTTLPNEKTLSPANEGVTKRDSGDNSLPTPVLIVIIVCSVGVVVIAITITTIVHLIMKSKRCKAYRVTRTSDANRNNNAPFKSGLAHV